MDNRKLIEKAVRKDPDAFCSLLQMYTQDMYRVALAILMNDEDAADALQDTALICWEKIGTLKKPEYFRTWLIRIVINKSREILRKNRKYTDIDSLPEPEADDRYNPELKEALRSLDEKYRVPVILYYYEGYDNREIGEILKIPQSTVRTRLQRAREKLKVFLSEPDAEEKKDKAPRRQINPDRTDHNKEQQRRGEYNAYKGKVF